LHSQLCRFCGIIFAKPGAKYSQRRPNSFSAFFRLFFSCLLRKKTHVRMYALVRVHRLADIFGARLHQFPWREQVWFGNRATRLGRILFALGSVAWELKMLTQKFRGYFFPEVLFSGYVLIVTKYWLGYTLGDFFQKKNIRSPCFETILTQRHFLVLSSLGPITCRWRRWIWREDR
jgi:hypothetical protein